MGTVWLRIPRGLPVYRNSLGSVDVGPKSSGCKGTNRNGSKAAPLKPGFQCQHKANLPLGPTPLARVAWMVLTMPHHLGTSVLGYDMWKYDPLYLNWPFGTGSKSSSNMKDGHGHQVWIGQRRRSQGDHHLLSCFLGG